MGVGNKVRHVNDGVAADGDDPADDDYEEPSSSSQARKGQDAEDRQLKCEMEQEVGSDDDHDECAADGQHTRKHPVTPGTPNAAQVSRNMSSRESKATTKSLKASAEK